MNPYDYVRLGLEVFPCRPPVLGDRNTGKDPLTQRGCYDASSDPRYVDMWEQRFPGCNWALHPPAGVLVIDVDTDASVGKTGAEELEVLLARLGPLPATLTCRTGSGGLHLYFRHQMDHVPGKAPGCRSIDIKKRGGYLILPPSLHHSGNRYEWLAYRPIEPLPAAWATYLDPPRAQYERRPVVVTDGGAAILEWLEMACVDSAEINFNVWRASKAAASGGVLDDIVEDIVAIAQEAATEQGKESRDGERQTRRTIESGRSAAMREIHPASTPAPYVTPSLEAFFAQPSYGN